MISGAKWRLIGYWQGCSAMELRLRVSRSTVDIDLTMQRVPTGATASSDTNRLVREMLQSAASNRYPIEARRMHGATQP